MTTTPSISKAIDKSEYVASWTNVNEETYGSLWWFTVKLYRHPRGYYFLHSTGGGGMRAGQYRRIDDDEAMDFVVESAMEFGTGRRYSRDEAVRLLAGETVEASLSWDTCPDCPTV